jgi:outer membrane receptor protein involved in Fe transport
LTSLNVKGDGTLFETSGGPVRAAFGANFRRETLEREGESFFFGSAPSPFARVDVDRSIKAVFAELLVPLFGPANGQAGLRRLELSAAVRHEDYSDFGSTTNPKFGAVWEPVTGLSLRGSYGTSFRAPALREVGDPLSISATQLPDAAGRSRPVLFLTGGNPDLAAEKARSITLGARFAHPASGVRGRRSTISTPASANVSDSRHSRTC